MRRAAHLTHVLVLFLAAAHAPAATRDVPKDAAPATGRKKAQLERLDAWASKIVYDSRRGVFHLTGTVSIIKGSLRIDCTEMTGHVDPKTRAISRVVAVGSVRMITVRVTDPTHPVAESSDPWRGRCGKADFDLKAGRVLMQSLPGQPRPLLWNRKGSGEADTIIFFPEKGDYILEGNPKILGEMPTGPAESPPTAAP